MDIVGRFLLSAKIDEQIKAITWSSNDQEPDCVARLVKNLPRIISDSLKALYPSRSVSVGGAFIHQKPLAHFLNRPGFRDPELGDLLLVVREKRSFGHAYNALLLQAKCVNDVFCASVPVDHQFILYSEWPTFKYVRAGALNGRCRTVRPRTLTQGAEYLLIDRKTPSNMYTASVNNPLEAESRFAYSVASVIAFDRGRTFQVHYPRDRWSEMILDLLKMSANAVFNRRRSGYIRTNRWTGDRAFMYLLNDESENEIIYVDDINIDDEKGYLSGVSTICVDLGVSELDDSVKSQRPKWNEMQSDVHAFD